MSRRYALLMLLCAASVACGSPTLWIGTAHSDVAGQAASDDPPWRAAASRTPDAASSVQPPASTGIAADAGAPQLNTDHGSVTPSTSPMAAAGSSSHVSDAGTALADDDAGKTHSMGDPTQTPLSPKRLPTVEGQCPELKGNGQYMFTSGERSLRVQIYMRADAKQLPAPGGPLVMYFHSFGTNASEVTSAFTQAAIDKVVAQGGVVAAFNDTPCISCGLPDDVVWYNEDDVVSDQVVACAIQEAQIDTRRIHALGFSAGALHSMHLALARSNYIASVVSYSGGMPVDPGDPQDPDNKVAALLSYGRQGLDNAVVDFNVGSRNWYANYHPKGYYSLHCDHDGAHVIPPELPAHVLRFLLDHPYRVNPEPYEPSVPSEFPAYCSNIPH